MEPRDQCYVLRDSVRSSEEAREIRGDFATTEEFVIFLQSSENESQYRVYCVNMNFFAELVADVREKSNRFVKMQMFGFPILLLSTDLVQMSLETWFPRMQIKQPYVFVFQGYARDPDLARDDPMILLPWYDPRRLQNVPTGMGKINEIVQQVEHLGDLKFEGRRKHQLMSMRPQQPLTPWQEIELERISNISRQEGLERISRQQSRQEEKLGPSPEERFRPIVEEQLPREGFVFNIPDTPPSSPRKE